MPQPAVPQPAMHPHAHHVACLDLNPVMDNVHQGDALMAAESVFCPANDSFSRVICKLTLLFPVLTSVYCTKFRPLGTI